MPHRLHRSCILFVLTSFAACRGGHRETPPVAVAAIPGDGGTLAVADGVLAGLVVEIPPGALDRPLQLGAEVAIATAHPGFRSVGRAVRFAPATTFRLPVTVTLPFPPASLGSNETVILQRDSAGGIVELEVGQLDPAGRATFSTRSLATCWVAERLFLGVGTEEFLPLEDGNTWLFANELSVTATLAVNEPNLPGVLLYKLEIAAPGRRWRGYVERHWSGATNLLGTWSDVGTGFQELHAPTRLLPARCTIGQELGDVFAVTGYAPYGAEVPTATTIGGMHLVPSLPPPLVTAVGEYADLLRFAITLQSWTPAGQSLATEALALTFARFVGPVAITAFGTTGELVGGVVGGVPLGR